MFFILKFSAFPWAQGSSCLPGMRGGEFHLAYLYPDPAFEYADYLNRRALQVRILESFRVGKHL